MNVRQQMNTFFASLMEATGQGQSGQVVNTPMGPFTFNPLTQTWTNVNNGMRMSATEFQMSMYGMGGLDYTTTTSDSGTTTPSWTPYVPPSYITTLDFNFRNGSGSCLSPYLSYSRTGLAYSAVEEGRLQLVGADTPRYYQDVCYIPGDAGNPFSGKIGGVLLEPQRTNYVFNTPYINPVSGTTFAVDQWSYSATGAAGMLSGFTLDAGLHGTIYGPDGVTNAFFLGFTSSIPPSKQPALVQVSGEYLYTDQTVLGYQSLRYKTGNYLDTSKPITISFYVGTDYPNDVTALGGSNIVPIDVRLLVEANCGVGVTDANTVILDVVAASSSAVTYSVVQPSAAYYCGINTGLADDLRQDGGGAAITTGAYTNWQRVYFTIYRTSSVAGAGANQSVEIKFRLNPAYPLSASGGANAVAIWGLQIEQGNFPTSLIPTASASGTRGADILTCSGIAAAIGTDKNSVWLSSKRFGAEPTNLTGITFSDIVKFYQTEGTSGNTYFSIGNYLPNRGNTILGAGTANRFNLPIYSRNSLNGTISQGLYGRANLNAGGTYQSIDKSGLFENHAMIRYNLNDMFLTALSYPNGIAGGTGISSFLTSGGSTLAPIDMLAFNPQQINAVGINRLIWFKGSTGDVEMYEGVGEQIGYVSIPPTSL